MKDLNLRPTDYESRRVPHMECDAVKFQPPGQPLRPPRTCRTIRRIPVGCQGGCQAELRKAIATLVGWGLRRSEVAELKLGDIQQRDERWVILDLYAVTFGPFRFPWVKEVVDCWATVIWCVVKGFASKANLGSIAPHDLRRTCARLCHVAGAELEQIPRLHRHTYGDGNRGEHNVSAFLHRSQERSQGWWRGGCG